MPAPHAVVVLLGSSRLSLIPGLSGAGRTPEDTWHTPGRDAAFVTGSGPLPPCLTVAGVTRAMCTLTGISPFFFRAGYAEKLSVSAPMLSRTPAGDPREGPSVPDAEEIVRDAAETGATLGEDCHTLWLGECIPGGTTHALCILRALGIRGRVSSSAAGETVIAKEAVWKGVQERCPDISSLSGTALIRETGDPVMAAAYGLLRGFPGETVLCGATQMLAVAALAGDIGGQVSCAMTDRVWQDPAADVAQIAEDVGIPVTIAPVPVRFVQGQSPSRACIDRVKEGFGAGGALALARRCGFSEAMIETALAASIRQE
ncbi:nicotinate-nucleotide--dimethylbenzimidazole phosphoribosyltransferase family protein [Methanogenium organophilum]|uniref:TIGR00303 family protein n=1 Tax=Methanogenium organophilum TaxID=2199 RepID=A0A9X9T6P7_METOG|nr:TIGR00303 family protein [Methanogenium organophilum]WAI00578.1 TIGR00303 family protein [Methanogenium organophilum]